MVSELVNGIFAIVSYQSGKAAQNDMVSYNRDFNMCTCEVIAVVFAFLCFAGIYENQFLCGILTYGSMQ